MKKTIFEISLEGEKLMKVEISPQAQGLDVIACFEAFKKTFDAATWANVCAFDSFEAEEPVTGRIFKIVCLEKAK
jgi:hypothetical protein